MITELLVAGITASGLIGVPIITTVLGNRGRRQSRDAVVGEIDRRMGEPNGQGTMVEMLERLIYEGRQTREKLNEHLSHSGVAESEVRDFMTRTTKSLDSRTEVFEVIEDALWEIKQHQRRQDSGGTS